MVRTVDVLGTKYMIQDKPMSYDDALINSFGYTECFSKEIILCKEEFEERKGTFKEIGLLKNKVMRHELLHALAFESGQFKNTNLQDEDIIDWIAIMYPKMKKIFEELEIEK